MNFQNGMMKELKSKCDMILHAMLGPNQIEGWWNSPNKAFDMKPAKEMFEEDAERVYRYLLNQVQR